MIVLIIEDEARAANHLERLLKEVVPEMQVVAKIESVRDALAFLNTKPAISLIFSDIQLADGLSFEIFNQVNVNCPIIFTTAYDQYAIEAFKTNGIDYLLKPIEEDRLKQAIEKVKSLSGSVNLEKLLQMVDAASTKSYKSRFMIKVGDKIKSIVIEDIKAFYSLEKASYLHTQANRNYVVDYSLDELITLIDPNKFFKINRKYIVSFEVCTHIIAYSNSRLKLTIDGIDDKDIIVAREKVQEFKSWLNR
ncbi:MAG: response regulator transcription factor [Salinivirgaceae bacterium]|nr:response regulator transcription factor [Salinivirgaceae bacterium]